MQLHRFEIGQTRNELGIAAPEPSAKSSDYGRELLLSDVWTSYTSCNVRNLDLITFFGRSNPYVEEHVRLSSTDKSPQVLSARLSVYQSSPLSLSIKMGADAGPD